MLMDKMQKRAMKLALRDQALPGLRTGPLDCACVIHGDGYSWDYVDRLYNMLTRNLSCEVRLHVYTEEHRHVPAPMIKHVLENWNIQGPRRSWWYKMQLFNPQHHAGPLLYFDLDLLIIKNIDWIAQLPLDTFWSVRDFKHLWRPTTYDVNSSIMWWDTTQYDWLWKHFRKENIAKILSQYHGDQNFINDHIPHHQRRCFDTARVKSWRWQCLDGGYDFAKKRYRKPQDGTRVDNHTDIVVFHGQPKPGDLQDPLVLEHWK